MDMPVIGRASPSQFLPASNSTDFRPPVARDAAQQASVAPSQSSRPAPSGQGAAAPSQAGGGGKAQGQGQGMAEAMKGLMQLAGQLIQNAPALLSGAAKLLGKK